VFSCVVGAWCAVVGCGEDFAHPRDPKNRFRFPRFPGYCVIVCHFLIEWLSDAYVAQY
jgi:hypothetical protein